MKITSFNTLFYQYSNGQTSIHDQLRGVQEHLDRERPDVLVAFEMPNPHQAISSDNFSVLSLLWQFESSLREQGYRHIKQLNDKLSIWIISKCPLVPLLLLGSGTVSGAIANMFAPVPLETVSQGAIHAESTYPQCLRTAMERDRSMIVGVQVGERVLPLIALHAKCLFFNRRFGQLLLFFLRAFVATKGLVLTDINCEVSQPHDLSRDPRFAREMGDAIAKRLSQWPLGQVNAAQGHTATNMSYPFNPLSIDCLVSPSSHPLRVGGDSDPVPSAQRGHTSDHHWIAVDEVPEEWMLEERSARDSHQAVRLWSESHSTATKHYLNRLPFPTEPVLPVTAEPLETTLSDQQLSQAREYLQQHFPSEVKICHHALKSGSKALSSSNAFGPSCHPKCLHLHLLASHPPLQSLVRRDNPSNGGLGWREICAHPTCPGIHSTGVA
jgi:hypothetical protein